MTNHYRDPSSPFCPNSHSISLPPFQVCPTLPVCREFTVSHLTIHCRLVAAYSMHVSISMSLDTITLRRQVMFNKHIFRQKTVPCTSDGCTAHFKMLAGCKRHFAAVHDLEAQLRDATPDPPPLYHPDAGPIPHQADHGLNAEAGGLNGVQQEDDEHIQRDMSVEMHPHLTGECPSFATHSLASIPTLNMHMKVLPVTQPGNHCLQVHLRQRGQALGTMITGHTSHAHNSRSQIFCTVRCRCLGITLTSSWTYGPHTATRCHSLITNTCTPPLMQSHLPTLSGALLSSLTQDRVLKGRYRLGWRPNTRYTTVVLGRSSTHNSVTVN